MRSTEAISDAKVLKRHYYLWHRRHMAELKQKLAPELYETIARLWAPIWGDDLSKETFGK